MFNEIYYENLKDQIVEQKMSKEEINMFLRRQALLAIESDPIINSLEKALLAKAMITNQVILDVLKQEFVSNKDSEYIYLEQQLDALKSSIIERHLSVWQFT
jgi:hypothetical protein